MKANKKLRIKLLSILFTITLCFANPFFATAQDTIARPSESISTVEPITEKIAPLILHEDISKRGEFEKHFLCDDGSYMAVTYPEAVHMQKAGQWVDIEYNLSLRSDQYTPDTEMPTASFSKEFTNNQLVCLTSDDSQLRWSVKLPAAEQQLLQADTNAAHIEIPAEDTQALPSARVQNTQQLKTQNAQKESIKDFSVPNLQAELQAIRADQNIQLTAQEIEQLNTKVEKYNHSQMINASTAISIINYPNALGNGIDVRYSNMPDKIKEEVVVHEKGIFDSYIAEIQTDDLTAELYEDGSIAYFDEQGNAVFSTTAPVMYDAEDIFSGDISVALEQTETGWEITYTPDKAWMNDPERVYPVVIDPTTQNVAQTKLLDNYTYEGYTGTYNSSGADLYIGNRAVGSLGRKKHLSVWRVDTAYMPTIPTYSYVSGATFSIRMTNGSSTMRPIHLFHATNTWNSGTLKWANVQNFNAPVNSIAYINPENTNKVPAYIKNNGMRFTFSVTGIVDSWYGHSHSNNFGFAIGYARADTGADFNSFYSSDYRPSGSLAYIPYLTINYTTYIPIQNGIYYLQNAWLSKCLDVENAGNNTSAATINTIAYSFHGDLNQQWNITHQGNGWYRIQSMWPFNGNRYLNVSGNNINVSNATGDTTLFRILPTGNNSFRLVNKSPVSYTSVVGVNNNTASADYQKNVELQNYNSTNGAQQWRIKKVFSMVANNKDVGMDLSPYMNHTIDPDYLGWKQVDATTNETFQALKSGTVYISISHGSPDGIVCENGTFTKNMILSLPSNTLSKTKISLFIGCSTGGNGANNIVAASYQRGAKISIGFKETIWANEALYWANSFMTCINNGVATATSAMNYADQELKKVYPQSTMFNRLVLGTDTNL